MSWHIWFPVWITPFGIPEVAHGLESRSLAVKRKVKTPKQQCGGAEDGPVMGCGHQASTGAVADAGLGHGQELVGN